MQFDLLTIFGFGAVTVLGIVLHRRFRVDPVVEEDRRRVGQQRDVARALKSMRKD